MEKREIYSLVLMVVFMVGVATAQDAVNARAISPKEWNKLVLESKLPVMVLYTTIPCTKSSDKRYIAMCIKNQKDFDKMAKDMNGWVNVYKIDVDDYPGFKSKAITEYGNKGKESAALFNGGKYEGSVTP